MPDRKRSHGLPCFYCQRPMQRYHRTLEPTRDHVVPKSRNGRKIVICCIKCNGMKADMLPEEWTGFMAAHPQWWLLTKYDLRAIRRAPKAAAREAKWGPRKPARQGSPPAKPVVVPPELIWTANQLRPYERAMVLLQAERDATRQEQAVSIDEPQPQPSRSDEACPR
jgi:hypothetical protein